MSYYITQNIFLHNKYWLYFIDTTTNTSQKVTIYDLKEGFIWDSLYEHRVS